MHSPTQGQDEQSYFRPETVDAAIERLDANEEAIPVAGGQTLTLLLEQGDLDVGAVVDISQIDNLCGIEEADGTVSIGAATTYADLADHRVSTTYPAIGDAVAELADPQVRTMGTVGGAVASGQSALDLVAVLLSHDATVRIVGPDGTRSVSLADLYEPTTTQDDGPVRMDFIDTVPTVLDEAELVTAIQFSAPDTAYSASAYNKLTNVAGGWTVASAGACISLTPDGERFETVAISLAGVAPTGVRAADAESTLAGEPVTSDTIRTAAERVQSVVDPADETSGSQAYKAAVATTLTERAIDQAVERVEGDE